MAYKSKFTGQQIDDRLTLVSNKPDLIDLGLISKAQRAAFYQEYEDNDYEIPDKYESTIFMWGGVVGYFNTEDELQFDYTVQSGAMYINRVVTINSDGSISSATYSFNFPQIINGGEVTTTAKSIAINDDVASAVANNIAVMKILVDDTYTDAFDVSKTVTSTIMLSQKSALNPDINDGDVVQAFAIFEGYGRDGSTLIRVQLTAGDETWESGQRKIQKLA